MEKDFNGLPETIKQHLKSITETSGLPDTPESLAMITDNWFEKKNMFEAQIKSLDMLETDTFAKDDRRGALMLTHSGSLISLGPLRNGSRWVEYSSDKLRSDVPDILVEDDAKIAADTGIDKILEFEKGPLKSTSLLLKIAVCRDDIGIEEQDMRIREATVFLTNGFIKINRSMSIHEGPGIAQFTMKSIVSHVAAKNGITQSRAKKIIDDFIYIIESGMLLNERVPLGRLGRLLLKLRPAQKARVGRNPRTGEEVTIKAKSERPVPKMTFSRYIKEKAANAKIEPTMDEDTISEEDDADEDES